MMGWFQVTVTIHVLTDAPNAGVAVVKYAQHIQVRLFWRLYETICIHMLIVGD